MRGNSDPGATRRSAGRGARFALPALALLLGGGWRRGEATARAEVPVPAVRAYADGHSRPRALAVDARGDRLYVAASTADRLVVIDLTGPRPVLLTSLRICAFPDALAALPGGGVVVSCRFDPELRVVTRTGVAADKSEAFPVRAVPTGLAHGNRGLALDPSGRFAYVGSPARGGVKIVELGGASPRFFSTGASPQGLRFAPPDPGVGRTVPLLLVANFIGHTVGVYPVLGDGGVGPRLQTIETAAPILALTVLSSQAPARAPVRGGNLGGALLLATHEDRALSRERLAVEGLDSAVLILRAAAPGAAAPFIDPGPGRRLTLNLSERSRDPVVGLDALAFDEVTGRVAIAGAGSDNLVVADADALAGEVSVDVGTSPSAVAFLPGGGVVTADRLSDTLSFVHAVAGASAVTDTLVVGKPERTTPAERGEVLFYGRRLVPHNVATGPLSIYTCAACHPDGHIDGRRHPSKRDRFFSMTKTCRGLRGTEPFLSLGKPDTFSAFADNIVATHAQGALDAPDSYDQYPVTLRLRDGARWDSVTLSPQEVRAALASYLPYIPVEPSPFEPVGRTALTPPERNGLAVFRDRCSGCHQLQVATAATRAVPTRALEPDLLAGQLVLTSARRYAVGTPVLGDNGNNPPSLRGVWAAAPYFSDGSAATLEDVIRRTDPSVSAVHAPENATRPPAFTASQRADLIAFLRGL